MIASPCTKTVYSRGTSILKLRKSSTKSGHTWEVVFVLATSLVMFCLSILAIPFFEIIEMKAWDLHFRERGSLHLPSDSVCFVTIDEESVQRDGRWPWPRRQMARLLKTVQDHGAKVIGLDMGFFEPDLRLGQKAILSACDRFKNDPSFQNVIPELESFAQREDDDRILTDTIKHLSIPLVLGHFFYVEDEYAEKGSAQKGNSYRPPEPPKEVLQKAFPRVLTYRGQVPAWGRLKEADSLQPNTPQVEESSRYVGCYNVISDQDGSVRRMPLVLRYDGRIFPTLALQMLDAAYPDRHLTIKVDSEGVEEIRFGNTLIPTNKKGQMLLNFYGPGGTFPHFSASKLLHDELPKDCLKDRLVVIGNTTMGLFDMRPTPVSEMFPGVEVHCVVLENILHHQFLKRPQYYILFDFAAIFALALIFLLLQARLKGVVLSGAVLALLGGYVWFTHYMFLGPGIWVSHVYPILGLVVSYIGTAAHRYMKEEREKRQIRQTFSLYVPRSVVEEMLAHPERLRLGGEKKELSVFFSDIRGFTTLSEKLPAEELVPQLNEYLTRMTQIVFDHQGTLDKYIGDAIMAIFGAPLTQEDHSYRACSTALDMEKTLKALQAEWQAQGKPILKIGIGINTGLMMVGNMGSEGRFDYTVLGDNVNLASRLEGLTKKYGVTIVLSESTWEAAGGRFVGRELDIVRVKGKQNPVAIFELMARAEESESYREPIEVYSKALHEFRLRNWQSSLELFKKVENWWPADAPSLLYQNRCLELLEKDPGPDWSFVTVLDSK